MTTDIRSVLTAAVLLVLLTLATAAATAAEPRAASLIGTSVAGMPVAVDAAPSARRDARAAREELRRRIAPAIQIMP